MERLLNITKSVIWIDHHISTIKTYENFPHNIEGFREDGTAGCVLTYEWFASDGGCMVRSAEHHGVPMPIQYIGDRDVWEWKYGTKTAYFCSGAELYDLHPLSKDWEDLFMDMGRIIVEGAVVEKYKAQRNREYMKEFHHEAEFEGYKADVINIGQVDSKIFDCLPQQNPIQIMYVFTGKFYKVSLRSTQVDVSEIATKYGGGGHKEASGFECTELPWKVIE